MNEVVVKILRSSAGGTVFVNYYYVEFRPVAQLTCWLGRIIDESCTVLRIFSLPTAGFLRPELVGMTRLSAVAVPGEEICFFFEKVSRS